MDQLKEKQIQTEYVETRIVESIAILKVKQDGFKNLSKIDVNSRLFEWTELQGKSKNIKSILVFFEKDTLSEEKYHNFLKGISDGASLDYSENQTLEFTQKNERSIEINMLFNYARLLSRINKLVIFCGSGEVVTPYFGISLLADVRFVTEDMEYVLAHKKYGLHPSGLLPFLLPKYIGLGRAKRILLSEDKITAEEAYELGIVDKIFSSSDFEAKCIEEILKYSKISQNVITSTKDLICSFDKEIEQYITKEQNYTHQ